MTTRSWTRTNHTMKTFETNQNAQVSKPVRHKKSAESQYPIRTMVALKAFSLSSLLIVFGLDVKAQIPLVRLGSSTDAAGLKAVVDQFRSDLGARREITWDGVPDSVSAPHFLPGNFFNSRGVFFSTPGAGVQVSAKSNNPTSTAVRFGNINPTYPDIFKTFSAERLFSPIGSAIVNLSFVVPGTEIPAVVKGFGAVYADADQPNATSFEYFDAQGYSLGQFLVPVADNGLSFLGVSFESAIISRVRIAYGNNALGPDDGNSTDVAVMDDFIYSEPQAQTIVSVRTSEVQVCWLSTTNVTYQVQYRSELTTNVWTSLLDCVEATASETCVSDSVIPGQPRRFYRVIQSNCVPVR